MKVLDVSSIQNIPGYVEILKFVLKSQIQNLVDQLQDHAGEETLVLSANLTAGTLSHLESDRGQGFLEVREDITSQFLTHCLQGNQKYHTAEPPRGHGVTGLLQSGTSGLAQPSASRLIQPGTIGLAQPCTTQLAQPGITGLSQPGPNGLSQSGSNGLAEPGLTGISHPGTTGISHPGTAGISQPATNGLPLPGTNELLHSGTIGLEHHGTTALAQPCTTGLSQPGTTGLSQPGTTGLSQPGTTGLSHPGTTGLSQPGITGLPHPGTIGLRQTGTTGLAQSGGIELAQPSNIPLLQPGTTLLLHSGSTGFSNPGTTELSQQGTNSTGLSMPGTTSLAQPGTIALAQPGTTVMSTPGTMALEQSGTTTLTQPGTTRIAQSHTTVLLQPGISGVSHSIVTPVTNPFTIHSAKHLSDSLLKHVDTEQDEIVHSDNSTVTNRNSNKTSLVGSLLPSVEPLANLQTINQAAVRDLIGFSLNAQVLPQITQPYQATIPAVKSVCGIQNCVPTVKTVSSASLLYPETVQTLSGNEKGLSPMKSVQSTSIHRTGDVHISGLKPFTGTSLLHNTNVPAINSQQGTNLLPQLASVLDITKASTAMEQVTKTTKRKQKRNTKHAQSKTTLLVESPVKKARIFESILHQNLLTLNPLTTAPSSGQSKGLSAVPGTSSTLSDLPGSVVPNAANFSLLNMHPVVLVNESNPGSGNSRNVFIESGTADPPVSCSKIATENSRSLIFELNSQVANTPVSINRPTHVPDVKEKDKSKKTLSSKIDEITQRIKKDDAIKQHTVQTSELVYSSIHPGGPSTMEAISNSGCLTTEAGSPDAATTSEHLNDGDLAKLKDGSRASHRKPKLPRFNIGVASDDEDNAEISESPNSVYQENATQSSPSLNPFGSPQSQSSMNISHEDSQDIINIQVSNDDSEASFSHINLEELADGLLLTDLPIVSYYNSAEDSSKSLIETVFNLKPGRDPSTKKPLNAQSVIVSGSKQEKDWVKCPLCPDKFLTVEALQYHIKNVNHVSKKYECDLCRRKFSQLRDMERHRRIHTGERPFTCDICNKSFSRKDNLKSHVRKHAIKCTSDIQS